MRPICLVILWSLHVGYAIFPYISVSVVGKRTLRGHLHGFASTNSIAQILLIQIIWEIPCMLSLVHFPRHHHPYFLSLHFFLLQSPIFDPFDPPIPWA